MLHMNVAYVRSSEFSPRTRGKAAAACRCGGLRGRAPPHAWKGKKVDLVLGDEHTGDAGVQRREALGIEGDILFGGRFTGCRQQGVGRIQHAEADAFGLLPKAVAPGEAGH